MPPGGLTIVGSSHDSTRMRRLPALVAALLIPAAQPFLVGTASSTGTLLLAQSSAQAQTAEAVAKAAQAITVRIEGATQGSGVLVKRDGTRYTVLTAWHVVSGQRPGEELDIYTPDGQKHRVNISNIRRIGDTDAASLSFSSTNNYDIAKIVRPTDHTRDEAVTIYGFPTSAGGKSVLITADLLAISQFKANGGYQIYYATKKTSTGMSGGPILTSEGELIGIHARGLVNDLMARQTNKLIKLEVNSGILASSILKKETLDLGSSPQASAKNADDYFVIAAGLHELNSSPKRIIHAASKSLENNQRSPAKRLLYIWRGNARQTDGDNKGAISDFTKALEIQPDDPMIYYNLGNAKSNTEDLSGAIQAYDKMLSIDPSVASGYFGRGNVKNKLGQDKAAIIDYNKSIELNPLFAEAYTNRGAAKMDLGDDNGAFSDFKSAIKIAPTNPTAAVSHYNIGKLLYHSGDKGSAILEFSKAVSIDPRYTDPLAARGLVRHELGDIQAGCNDFRRSAILGNTSGRNLFGKRCGQ